MARPGAHCDAVRLPRRSARPGPRDRCCRERDRRDPRAAPQRCCGPTSRSAPSSSTAITAPLEPAVVIAGAGSGKTTVMAARVVWLVATGQVVAGRGPRAHLHHQGHRRAGHPDPRVAPGRRAAPGPGTAPRPVDRPGGGGRGADRRDVPLVRRRPAHRARPPDRPRARHPADRRRIALPAGRAHDRPPHRAGPAPQRRTRWSCSRLLALDGELSEHLVTPAQVRALDAAERVLFVEGMEGEGRKTYRERNEKAILAIDRRAELLELVAEYRALKRHHALMDFSDQIALTARLARDCPEVGEAERARFKVVLLDEYQDTSVAQALHALPALQRARRRPRARAPGDRGRRPQPGHLRLAWCVGLQHPGVLRGVPVRGRPRRVVPPRRSTAAPTSRSSTPPTIWRASSTCSGPSSGRSSRGPTRRRARSAPASSRRTTPSSPPWGTRWRPRTPRWPSRRGARSGCSPATTAMPPTSSTPSPAARSRSRSSASRVCSGCPRWPRWSPRSPSCRTSPPTPRC